MDQSRLKKNGRYDGYHPIAKDLPEGKSAITK
jgi:hypothetical protein